MVRELERENRIVSFRLTIPDRPGVLGQIATRLGRARRQHSRSRSPAAVSRRAGQGRRLDVTVETRDAAHAEDILAAFKAEGFAPVRIATGDAME